MTEVCRFCGQPIEWSETVQRWVTVRGLLFPHPAQPHEPAKGNA